MNSWISKNNWLTMPEMENNAVLVWEFFSGFGWTIEAVAGMLGNMQSESNINPGIWEGLDPFVGGYGLVQWTPYTKYSEWAGEDWQNNGPRECARIIYELENRLQWIKTAKYPMSFSEFVSSTDSPSELAQVWLYNYERPTSLDQPWRSTQAEHWYEFLGGVPPIGKIPPWLLFKFRRGIYVYQ